MPPRFRFRGVIYKLNGVRATGSRGSINCFPLRPVIATALC